MDKLQKTNSEGELINVSEMSLNEKQFLEQLYSGAGLEPVVEAGIRDYDERLQKENKLLNKVLGTRGSDIKGYGGAVARRVAFAVFQMLNREYGGKVGDLRANIMALQEERDRAKDKYDELMGRVVGMLGAEYRDLRADSREFMQKLTGTLGEDLKEARIDKQALAETLADIDGLRDTIKTLENEKIELDRQHAAEIERLNSAHAAEVEKHQTVVVALEQKCETMQQNNVALARQLEELQQAHKTLRDVAAKVKETVPAEEIGQKLSDDMHEFMLKDSKVPQLVMEGVGKFIDMKKYLKLAASKGVEQALVRVEKSLSQAMGKDT